MNSFTLYALLGISFFMNMCFAAFTTGETSLTRLTLLETTRRLGYIRDPSHSLTHRAPGRVAALAPTLDWRSDPRLAAPAPAAGACAADWAVAIAQTTGDRAVIAGTRAASDLSPQSLLSCHPRTDGCGGATPLSAWLTARSTGMADLTTEPFTAPETGAAGTCNTKPVVKASRARGLRGEAEIVAALQSGPVVACMDVYADFIGYTNGVYAHESAVRYGKTYVSIVGYDESQEEGKYWVVRTAFGEDFGMNGYAYVARGRDEAGIETVCPSY